MKKSVIFLLSTFILISCSKTYQGDIIINKINLVDIDSGKIIPNQTIVISGNKIDTIVDFEADLKLQSERIIDGTGKYVIPGLWDMHTHTSSIPITRDIFFPLFVANGITGIRNMASDCFDSARFNCIREGFADPYPSIYEFNSWKKEIEKGKLIGPQIVAGSAQLNGPQPGEPSSPSRPGTPQHAREHAHILKERGVDFAKIYNFISRDAYFAFAEEANKIGMKFAGHVPEWVKASEASDLGQRSIEHAAWGNVAEECSSREEEVRQRLHAELESDEPDIMSVWLEMIESHDAAKCAEVYETLVRNGTWVTPTLFAGERLPGEIGFDWRNDPRLRYLPREEREYWVDDEEEFDSFQDDPRASELARFERAVTLAQHRAGVPLLAGSDSGGRGVFTGFSLHDELRELVAIGLTEAEALRTATLEPARYLEAIDSLGTVEAGKLADLVLLDANPLQDIQNTQKISAVIANGRYFDRKTLDEILENVAREAQKN